MKNPMRRIGRLAELLPDQDIPGDRRKDHVTRASVDEVPPGTDEDIIERRRNLARRTPMTTVTDIAAKILEGKSVEVFQKPISREESEGRARVLKVHRYDTCSPEYGIADCDVEFEGEEGQTFRRQIRFDS